MIRRKILIVDKLVTGYNHIVFNAAITSVIAKIYENDIVIFIAESVHAGAISKKNADVFNLEYQPYIETPLPLNKIKKIITLT